MAELEPNPNPTGLPRTQAESGRAREDTWPGDRIPAPSDAEIAYRSLDPRLGAVFKQAMLADHEAREQRQLLSQENAQALLRQAASLGRLSWPQEFFCASVQPIVTIDFNTLAHKCHELFLCTNPFLKDIPQPVFLRTPRPEYLTLAMASMGALMSEQTEAQALQLWHTSARQLIGTLDVDNTVARKTDLVSAWVLLETFGYLSSDRAVRRRTRMLHGCVKTAVWRILRETPWFDESSSDASAPNTRKTPSRLIMSYFLLIDLLHSIQRGQATSFSTTLFLRQKKLRTRNTTLAAPITQLVEENSESPLIAILAILADIHLVTVVFGPLTLQALVVDKSLSRSPPMWITNAPFTPAHEVGKLRRKLLAGLSEWKKDYFGSASNDVLLLYHFCHLYNQVPTLQALFTLSGYAKLTSSAFNLKKGGIGAAKGLREYCAAISTAWWILETSESMVPEELPIWAPLSVFSAGLVVWARNEFADDDYVDSWSARSLNPFRKELARMKFSGAREMSGIIANLEQNPLRGAYTV